MVLFALCCWVLFLLLPIFQIGVSSKIFGIVLLLTGLGALFFGILFRSAILLIPCYIGSLMLPLALTEGMALHISSSPLRFASMGVSLVCYLSFSHFWLVRPHPPETLTAAPSARNRFDRRLLLSQLLILVAGALPIALFALILHNDAIASSLHQMYSGRTALMKTLLIAAALLGWAFLFRLYFHRPLSEQRRTKLRYEAAYGLMQSKYGLVWLSFRLVLGVACGLIVLNLL